MSMGLLSFGPNSGDFDHALDADERFLSLSQNESKKRHSHSKINLWIQYLRSLLLGPLFASSLYETCNKETSK